MTTWWQEHDEFARANRSGHDQTLAPHLLSLLDDVEARFVAAGGDAMRWDDPHAIPGEQYAWRDTADDEYSRVTNPDRFAIVDVRFDAWVGALTAPNAENDRRPLADVGVTEGESDQSVAIGWPERDARRLLRATTVMAHNGAPSFRLTTRQAFDHDDLYVFDIGVVATPPRHEDLGNEPDAPIFRALHTPDCACDACDSGSDDLLQEIDQWILSIVDGSFEIIARDDRSAARTSFFGHSNLGDADATAETHTVVGRSWWPGKRSRPMMPPF